ncbi:hypothetical protein HNR00_003066 [Methylorubrum rhodinum]|uniref:Uncharacterized protein n=2 Tax=Methylorubrum rhodinum TaxID=29428 RepID=A0A840ZL79_9HYPH|nr:hypothetical protein [Methylorubrum rhodinum]
MAAANNGDEHDEAYEALDPFGIHVMRARCVEGVPVEDRHIRLQLEWMGRARLLDETMDGIDWGYLTLIASAWDEARQDRLRRLFELATGITDADAFDERLRAERRARESARG